MEITAKRIRHIAVSFLILYRKHLCRGTKKTGKAKNAVDK